MKLRGPSFWEVFLSGITAGILLSTAVVWLLGNTIDWGRCLPLENASRLPTDGGKAATNEPATRRPGVGLDSVTRDK